MKLAKQHVDVGIYTNNAAMMLEFWQQRIGLPFEETLPLGGGVRQHRHGMNGSVLKINDARDALADEGLAGYREIIIAREGIDTPESLLDPDGNSVTLVPRGHDGISGIGVRLAVRDEGAFHRFYGEALQLEAAGERAYRCGDSMLLFAHDPTARAVGRTQARGIRYMTVQVWDVDAEHAGIIARGGAEGRAPLTLGSTARISFVRDPDGNWIEVSQRASLTGALPG
jgi:catechol 2,3-dioxygenase-like lactoylglutathione lyase family enzyme